MYRASCIVCLFVCYCNSIYITCTVHRVLFVCYCNSIYVTCTVQRVLFVCLFVIVTVYISHVPCIVYCNHQMHTQYHNSIHHNSLCNLHCYMFRHCHVTIRQFTTNALLSYTRFLVTLARCFLIVNYCWQSLCTLARHWL